jgi:hypothetical protein
MSLYFSAAVWASLALCVFYSLEDHLPRYRTEATVAILTDYPLPDAGIFVVRPPGEHPARKLRF